MLGTQDAHSKKRREGDPPFRGFRGPAVREAKAMNAPRQPHDAQRPALVLLCALYIGVGCAIEDYLGMML